MLLGDLPPLEPLHGAAEISLTFGTAQTCRAQLGGKHITLSASVVENSFFCFIFSSPFSFFFSKQLQKKWIWIPAFAFKIKRGKKAAPKHGGFDLESCQNCLGFTDCPFVSGFISASSLSRKVFLWPSTMGSGVVWWQKLARHTDQFKFIISYFFLVCSGNLSLLFTWALSLLLEPFFFPERECLNASHSNPWK